GRVDVVVLAVVDAHLDVDHLEAGEEAAAHRLDDALLDRGDELPRDSPADDRVLEHEPAAPGHRLAVDVADPELPVAARLLRVLAPAAAPRGCVRLLVGVGGGPAPAAEAAPPANALDRDLEVQRALPRHDELARRLVGGDREAGVFLHQPVQGGADLL